MNSTSPSGAATVANVAYCYVLPVVCAIGVIGKPHVPRGFIYLFIYHGHILYLRLKEIIKTSREITFRKGSLRANITIVQKKEKEPKEG